MKITVNQLQEDLAGLVKRWMPGNRVWLYAYFYIRNQIYRELVGDPLTPTPFPSPSDPFGD
jgi:hypothetical protein